MGSWIAISLPDFSNSSFFVWQRSGKKFWELETYDDDDDDDDDDEHNGRLRSSEIYIGTSRE